MNREIEFQAKRLDNGQWQEGYIFQEEPPFAPFVSDKKEAPKWIILKSGFADWHLPRPTTGTEVDPKTIRQFTGLLDKNDKKIYQGDIVSFQLISKGQVVWNQQYCGYWIDFTDSEGKKRYSNFNVTFSDGEIWRCDSVEVIGNIHDNPELLK